MKQLDITIRTTSDTANGRFQCSVHSVTGNGDPIKPTELAEAFASSVQGLVQSVQQVAHQLETSSGPRAAEAFALAFSVWMEVGDAKPTEGFTRITTVPR